MAKAQRMCGSKTEHEGSIFKGNVSSEYHRGFGCVVIFMEKVFKNEIETKKTHVML